MATTPEILPAPVEVPTVTGEVIDPNSLLKQHESVIRKNFKKFEAIQQTVARSLNVIYYNDLWKLHKTPDGKRKYTNFGDYLTHEFGWDKTAARARQIMKADIPAAIEAGDVPAEIADKRRERSAPVINAVRAAKVTQKQLQSVLDAWVTRMENVEPGPDADELSDIYTESSNSLKSIIDELDTFIQDVSERESAGGDDDDASDDDSDDDSE